ncbi:MAG: fatty acid desaturase family protein [Pseudomonadota bacterium]
MSKRIDSTLAGDLYEDAAGVPADVAVRTARVNAEINALQRPRDFFTDAELVDFRRVSDLRGAWLTLHCWGVILLTWIAVSLWTNPLTILLGILIIGARQLGLAVLSHDGAHFALFRSRALNDWVSEWVLSRPLLGAGIESYRRYHLQHHAHTQQPEDPDLPLSAPFPITPASFRRKVWRDLTGRTGIKQYGGMLRGYFARGWLAGLRRIGPNLAINLAFLAGFALFSHWWLYFLLWWVPALTWNRFVTRLRNIGEHAAVPDNNDRLRNTRTISASWLERVFVAPYFVNFHLEHHLVVNAPCYRLAKVHECLIAKGFGPKMELQPDYRTMLSQAVVPA